MRWLRRFLHFAVLASPTTCAAMRRQLAFFRLQFFLRTSAYASAFIRLTGKYLRCFSASGLTFIAFTVGASAESATYCFKAQVNMPTLKNHLSWLSKNPRYGLEAANEVASNAEQSGDDFLRYQIFYHPELSASGWSEIETYSGIREKQTQIRLTQKWSCGGGDEKYPLLFLIGIEVKSIESGTIYVAPRPGTYGAISLKNLQENSRPISMRSADRNTMICPDVSVAEVGSQHSCINIAGALTQSKTAPLHDGNGRRRR
jgi:hypothetical protein